MGRGLFDEVREYVAVESQVDALLGYSLRQLCLEDPGNQLKNTQYTQPALYVTNALHYYKALSQGQRPTYVAGHSLGEYNALLAAGAFDFLTGLKLVQKRGELMSKARDGGMAAITGLSSALVGQVIATHRLTSIDVASFNTPTQTVVSGPVNDLMRAGPLFEKAGAHMFVPLQVSAAFHSRYVANAASEFGTFLQPMTFNAPRIPVIANVTARPYPHDNASEAMKDLLVRQITHSVQWTRTIRYLQMQGVTAFQETGPGIVLTRMIQQIQNDGQSVEAERRRIG
jgi:malonyl CoA-acyl carrier protein transacylase